MLDTKLYKAIQPMMNFSYMQRKWLEYKMRPICKAYGIKHNDLFLMLALHLNPDIQTAKDIEKYTEIKRANISVIVEKLSWMGLLEQKNVDGDRRKKKLVLTEQAGPILEESDNLINDYVECIKKDIPIESLAECNKIFEKMYTNLYDSAKSIMEV